MTGRPCNRARALRFAIVAARFNDFIVDQLIRGAVDALLAPRRRRQADRDRARARRVRPAAASRASSPRAAKYDAIVALGSVITRRHAAFRLRRGRMRGGSCARFARTPACRSLRRAHDRYDRAGDRARRHQSGQQGRRRGDQSDRARESVAPDRKLSAAEFNDHHEFIRQVRGEAGSGHAGALFRGKLAMQALYQWQLTRQTATEIKKQFLQTRIRRASIANTSTSW